MSLTITAIKAAPYVLTLLKPVLKNVYSLDDGMWKDLIEEGIDLMGDQASDKIKEYLKISPDAADGLIDQHLIRHTGKVLATLVKRYAKKEAVTEHRAELTRLAKATPDGWSEYVANNKADLPALRRDAFQRRLIAALNPSTHDPELDPEVFVTFFRWLAKQKGILTPLKSGVTPPLTRWITKNLNQQLFTELCQSTPEATAAHKESVIRFLLSANGKLERLDGMIQLLHHKTDASAAAVEDTRQSTKRIEQTLAKELRPPNAAAREKQYRAALLAAFSSYQELELGNYENADQASPDIWNIFVQPACSKTYLRPEEMDAAQRQQPPQFPAQELLPLLASPAYTRTTLLADPGMGKSTLIQSLIALIASGRSIQSARSLEKLLPVPLILRDLVPLLDSQNEPERWTWDELVTVLLKQYRRGEDTPLLLEAYSEDEPEFRQRLNESDVFFLVDGLDEIGDREKRRQLVRCIQDGIRSVHIAARWLITSRIIGYDESPVDLIKDQNEMVRVKTVKTTRSVGHLPKAIRLDDRAYTYWMGPFDEWHSTWRPYLIGEPHYEETSEEDSVIQSYFGSIAHRLYLAPFDDQRQDTFTRNWFKYRHTIDHSKALMREVRAHYHDGVRIVARVPNLLCMMNMLKRSNKPLPDGRAALYDEIVKAYLGGIESDYRHKPILGLTCPFESAERRQLLALLGAHMQRTRAAQTEDESDGNILINLPDLSTLLVPAIRSMQQAGRVTKDHLAESLLDELLRHIASRSGLLIPRSTDAEGNSVYGFTHLSFMEFFAADWLGREYERRKSQLARESEARADGINLTPHDLEHEFPPAGPIQYTRGEFPVLAANPNWHEVLIFFVESRKSDTSTLLRWLFPTLHVTSYELNIKNSDPNIPIMPAQAVALVMKLANDQELTLSPKTRQAWWRILWSAYLAWPHTPWRREESKRWAIAPLLLGSAALCGEVLQALVVVQPLHPDRPLYLYNCDQLTTADIKLLAGLNKLKALDLSHCTKLQSLPDLSGMHGLRKLEVWYCHSLMGEESFSGLTGLHQLEQLNLSGSYGLERLPDLSRLEALTWLSLTDCSELKEVEALCGPTGLKQLVDLDLSGCSELKKLPNMSHMQNLRTLRLMNCPAGKQKALLRQQLHPKCKVIVS